jgi:hypothetical protein
MSLHLSVFLTVATRFNGLATVLVIEGPHRTFPLNSSIYKGHQEGLNPYLQKLEGLHDGHPLVHLQFENHQS